MDNVKITSIMEHNGQGVGVCEIDGERFHWTSDGISTGTYKAYRLTDEEWDLKTRKKSPMKGADWKRVMSLSMDIHARDPDHEFRHEDVDWSIVGDPVRYVGEEGTFIKHVGKFYPETHELRETMVRYRIVVLEDWGPYKSGDLIWESEYHPQSWMKQTEVTAKTRLERVEYGITGFEVLVKYKPNGDEVLP